jgi:hypothetical protein
LYDCDVFVRLVPLPAGAQALVLPNDDLTYDVYVNSNICRAKQEKALDHELKHIKKDHFRSCLPIWQIESEADEP